MLGVLGGHSIPRPRVGWAQGNEEELLDHGKAEPGAPRHEGITAQYAPVHDEQGHGNMRRGSV